ncbi:MAG: hypothetical protein K9M07_04395 [Simkaniaceae bacterium]|nr:hypothetical protein [Simkaniaceae bacterium]
MTQTLFNEEQSRILALSFMQKLAEEYSSAFTEEGLSNLLKGIDCCLSDPLYPEAWRETYEVAFGQSFTPETRLTQEEIYTNLIEFCVRFIYDWGIDLSETVRQLFTIRFEFHRENGYIELRHYKKFLENIPAQQERVPSHSISVFKMRDLEPGFSMHQNNKNTFLGYAKLVIPEYLGRLRQDVRAYFSKDGFEEFSIYMGIIDGDAAFEDELLDNVHIAIFGKSCDAEPDTSTDIIFTLMIQHCAYYVFGFQFQVRELLNYLFLIRYKPQACQYENAIWIEEVDKLVAKYGY